MIYPLEHLNNVFGVVEWSNFIITSAVDNGHCLQADTLHCYLLCQQKPMIKVVEKLIPTAGHQRITLYLCSPTLHSWKLMIDRKELKQNNKRKTDNGVRKNNA